MSWLTNVIVMRWSQRSRGNVLNILTENAARAGEDVVIVIPTLNESKHLASVINTLREDQDCANALIVIADGGSRDDTIAITQAIGREDPRVIAVPSDKPLGISASVNKAVFLHGEGRDWLVRIDAHAEYPPNYPSRLVAKAKEMGADSVVTPMITKGANCFQKATSAASNSILGTGGAAHRMPGRGGWVDHGHHALFRLPLFKRVGGYDEGFTHNEDAELDHRLRKAGGRIWLEDALALFYYPRATAKALFKQYLNYGRGRARTIGRHGGRRHLRQMIPLAIPPILFLALFSPLFPVLALPALCWMIGCLGYGLLLFRPGDTCAAAAGIPAMIMHLAWSLGYWEQTFKGPERSVMISQLKSPG
jgi:succinoglycan biosynthesis protein ExoA